MSDDSTHEEQIMVRCFRCGKRLEMQDSVLALAGDGESVLTFCSHEHAKRKK